MTSLEQLELARDDGLLRATAEANGVCVRPVLQELIDTKTGVARTVAIPCGATRESKCPPCAAKARRLRIQQCREGWHREDEPEFDASEDQTEDTEESDDVEPEDPEEVTRRVRSTRRRQDVADLPRLQMTERTVGRAMMSPSGKTYRPSMFLTFTLPSYGRVRADGTPLDPDTYRYRQAALDAMHFPRLVDRLWQNLRRCAGFKVQYFSAVEEQKRLAPHLHAAVRGVIPRSVVLQVVAATYHQVWWPPCDEPVYTTRFPEWNEQLETYVCPWSGAPLQTWQQAMDELDAELEANPAKQPAHVLRFGKQADYKWLVADSVRTDKVLGYVTKYLTKSIADTYDPDSISGRQRAHVDRLMHEVRWLPCSPECANWLRFGIQPKDAVAGLEPGACSRAAHDPENLGFGGRRVLVSRQWTGKTLDEHRADRAAVVRQVLEEAGVDPESIPTLNRCSADVEEGRFRWEPVNPRDISSGLWRVAVLASLREAQARRQQYLEAKRAGPRSATQARQTAPAA
ncbi:replication initiator [Nocardioides cavernaquae]|uniref:Replication initiation protein n=1 Tax=Nocardioides cavernaquae TaxID=2321396 RepID=A0A3A5HAW9_9ACTN|nr:replication initiator [Nocardioides cavernaquae]RJS46555.1 replication initiation protein [Nocardioides cavernaquae]